MQEIAPCYALFCKTFPWEHSPGRRTPLPCAAAPGPPASGPAPPPHTHTLQAAYEPVKTRESLKVQITVSSMIMDWTPRFKKTDPLVVPCGPELHGNASTGSFMSRDCLFLSPIDCQLQCNFHSIVIRILGVATIFWLYCDSSADSLSLYAR